MTRVGLVHDVLAARAGGERVLLAMADAFPDAPITTLLFEPNATFSGLDSSRVHPTWLNRFGWLRQHFRRTLPVAALTYAATTIDADVVVCSTSGLSHHVRTTGAKVVYCHTPARWLHDASAYLDGFPLPVALAARVISPLFRRLDLWAMRSADQVIVNSAHIAAEVERIYGITAAVVSPASALDLEGPVEPLAGIEPGFILSPTRPLGYKRLDVLTSVARSRPDLRFVHVGEGPHRQSLLDSAPKNVSSFGAVSDAQLRWAYRNARVVALTCAEDFGLVPLEAAAHGVHTAAPAARGILDHDQTLLTRYTFASPSALEHAIENAPPPTGQRNHQFLGGDRFTSELRAIVESVIVESPIVEPDIVEPDIVEPDMVEPDIVEPETVESAP